MPGESLFKRSCESVRLRLYISLLGLDLAAVASGFLLASAVRLGSPFEEQALRTLAVVLTTFAAVALNNRSYSLESLQRPAAGAARATEALAYAVAVAIALLFSFKVSSEFSRLIFLVGTIAAVASLVGMRLLVGSYIGRKHRWRFANRVIIADGVSVMPEPGDRIIFADQHGFRPDHGDPVTLHRLGNLLRQCDSVLLACPPERRREWSHCLKGMAVEVQVRTPELDALGAMGMKCVNGVTTLVVGAAPLSLRDRILKRALDVAVSFCALLFFLPLLLFVAAAIKLDSPGPVLFRQQRQGHSNRLFHVLKFRSMRADAADETGVRSASPSDDRITRVGRFIRRTSIDELPQLLNVLGGSMSMVGPRPHALGSTAEDAPFWEVDECYFHRHAVKPGITGLAQVRGLRGATLKRRELTDRLHSDLEYLAGWTIWRDVKILANTFRVLVHPNAF